MDPEHILLSCTCNLFSNPPFFQAQVMPVEPPDNVKNAQLSDEDMFFLRWIFEVSIICEYVYFFHTHTHTYR